MDKQARALVPDSKHAHDRFILVTLQEAVAAKGKLYAEAGCFPAMKETADRLFKMGMKVFNK